MQVFAVCTLSADQRYLPSRLQGSSDMRYITCRLAPLHNDSLEDQQAQFYPLQELQPWQLAALQAAMPPSSELSFLQWCQKLGLQGDHNALMAALHQPAPTR